MPRGRGTQLSALAPIMFGERDIDESQQKLCRLEANKRPVRSTTVRKLAAALGIEPQKLMKAE